MAEAANNAEQGVSKRMRALVKEATPGPWTLDAGSHRMWICQVGNNSDDPEVWSAHENKVGVAWPFSDKLADARLIAAAPATFIEAADLIDELREALKAVARDNLDVVLAKQVRAALSKAGEV